MTRFKRWLTYAPATTGLPLGSSPLRGQRAPGSVSGRPLGPPSAQSPFARRGCDPRPSGVPHRFDQRYPVFVAPTGSCARPKPSRRFRSPYTTGLRRLRPAPAGRWSFPTLFPAILVWVLGPLPRGALQVRLSVPSLETPVFAPRECARRTKPPRTAAATRYLDFGAVAIPFPFRPPHSLDLQAAPTAAHLRAGRPGRLHHASPGWLPAPGCGIASCPTRTIDTAGLPPAGLQLCRLLLARSTSRPSGSDPTPRLWQPSARLRPAARCRCRRSPPKYHSTRPETPSSTSRVGRSRARSCSSRERPNLHDDRRVRRDPVGDPGNRLQQHR